MFIKSTIELTLTSQEYSLLTDTLRNIYNGDTEEKFLDYLQDFFCADDAYSIMREVRKIFAGMEVDSLIT